MKHVRKRENHGESKTPLWRVWNQMLRRCGSPTHQDYRFYGGRGIRVCEAWRSFTAFRDWSNANGYQPGLTLDREDSDGHYEPNNCQWITQAENARKCRNTHWLVEAFREAKTIGQWLADPRCPGLNESTIRMRLSRGWAAERAITTASRSYGA